MNSPQHRADEIQRSRCTRCARLWEAQFMTAFWVSPRPVDPVAQISMLCYVSHHFLWDNFKFNCSQLMIVMRLDIEFIEFLKVVEELLKIAER
jgi:hypothetical protein